VFGCWFAKRPNVLLSLLRKKRANSRNECLCERNAVETAA
jgi:hypothetical protein